MKVISQEEQDNRNYEEARYDMVIAHLKVQIELLESAIKKRHDPNIRATAHTMNYSLREIEAIAKDRWDRGV
jgi:hypothetical protein